MVYSIFAARLDSCLACLLVALLVSACESVSYYSQALSGQLSLLRAREPIDEVVNDEKTSESLRERLLLVVELRAFAERELLLPVNGQYRDYADLGRDYVVWNVFAAPELSLIPETWCYPIVGCAGYRGYFSKDRARVYAQHLAQRGWDTYVGGVAAYSTLGWMDDPVLNTFVYRGEPQLAELIFHELSHQLLYFPGDTGFNESFATAVAGEGVRRWLEDRGSPAQYSDYLQRERHQAIFVALVAQTRQKLALVYGSTDADAARREQKQAIITAMREEYLALDELWQGALPYDNWMAGPINNAQLNAVAWYHDLVPALRALLEERGGSLADFYLRCKNLEMLTVEERRLVLNASQQSSTPAGTGSATSTN